MGIAEMVVEEKSSTMAWRTAGRLGFGIGGCGDSPPPIPTRADRDRLKRTAPCVPNPVIAPHAVPISSTGAYLLHSARKSTNCAARVTGHVADVPKSARTTRADTGTARAFNLYVAERAIEGAGELRRINARQELLSRD